MTGVDALLAAARATYVRVDAARAFDEQRRGDALLVDIRPAGQRAAEGTVSGAMIIDRNVLEWRLDPTADSRIEQATGPDLRVVVLCHQGYASSLAAAALVQLGLHRATDVVGGFDAWKAAGLPIDGQPGG